MIISIYKCDICKCEFRDAKSMYEPKNGLCIDLKCMLKARYKISETCTECFEKVRDALHTVLADAMKEVD